MRVSGNARAGGGRTRGLVRIAARATATAAAARSARRQPWSTGVAKPRSGERQRDGDGTGAARWVGAAVRWQLSDRFDPACLPLADRHYNRRAIGSPQFVPPGRCIVLRTPLADAFWVTSWPFAKFVRHAWPGAWVCSAFRNEGDELSSELIKEAVAATCSIWDPPSLGIVTFVNAAKVRRKRDPGRCFLRAGFERCGETKGGLLAFQLLPDAMPESAAPLGAQELLFA